MTNPLSPLHIDGSHGEGGGQILRSSLALSLVTGRAFTMENIRANRRKPGLMRQHLTAVKAAAKICDFHLKDVDVGTTTLVFKPGKVRGGDYTFRVGTAGSVTLVLQTVLPALMLADEPSTLTLCGGTHNPMAPPFDFLQRVYLPLVNRMGPTAEATLVQYGFYPAGGGEFHVRITPVRQLAPLKITERGDAISHRARIITSRLPEHVGERERKKVRDRTNWGESQVVIENVTNSAGPGNVVMLEAEYAHVTELFTGFGGAGIMAERVAAEAVEAYHAYLAADAPVGEYLADQLLLPMGIAAWQGAGTSEFLTGHLSRHATTHIDILHRFLDIRIQSEQPTRGQTLVRVTK